jgi:hypothetical protein
MRNDSALVLVPLPRLSTGVESGLSAPIVSASMRDVSAANVVRLRAMLEGDGPGGLGSLLKERFLIRLVSSRAPTFNRETKSMQQKRTTSTKLARRLGINRSTLWRLKRQCRSEAPKSNDAIEEWRSFCLRHAVEPELIARLLER